MGGRELFLGDRKSILIGAQAICIYTGCVDYVKGCSVAHKLEGIFDVDAGQYGHRQRKADSVQAAFRAPIRPLRQVRGCVHEIGL